MRPALEGVVVPALLAAAIATGQVPPESALPAPGQVVNDAARPDPVKPKPKPKRPARVVSAVPAAWSAGDWGRFPARVERLALCVAHHESWDWNKAHTRRLYTAANDHSSARGFAQWVRIAWQAQTQRAGITGYPTAETAPPRIQAEVFAYQVMHHGMYPWAGTACPGT